MSRTKDVYVSDKRYTTFNEKMYMFQKKAYTFCRKDIRILDRFYSKKRTNQYINSLISKIQ